MGFSLRLRGVLTRILYLQLFCDIINAQNERGALPTFGDTVSILGAMARTNHCFGDGLALDIFSPKNRTLTVKQNISPLDAQFVASENGEQFVALSNYSYVIQTNEEANDLNAKIEVSYDPAMLKSIGVQEANTYCATLSNNKKNWVINETAGTLRGIENSTRIVNLTSLDGEYMLVGRRTVNAYNHLHEYGQGASRAVEFPADGNIHSAQFVDGMKFSVRTNETLTMNVILKQGVNPGTLPANTQSLNSFIWIVNTSAPFEHISAEMRVPFNRSTLVALRPSGSSPSTMLTVARRALNATSGQFSPINPDKQVVRELPEDRIQIRGRTSLDGQYIILVTDPKPLGQTPTAVNSTKPSKNHTRSPVCDLQGADDKNGVCT